MSRSGYSDDYNGWDSIRWRGAVKSAIRGRRGQAMLRELAAAMDAMPVKELITEELEYHGSYCTLGVLGAARQIDMDNIDPDDREQVAKNFNIAPALSAEIVFENDEGAWLSESPAQRWVRMRRWVSENIINQQETSKCLES